MLVDLCGPYTSERAEPAITAAMLKLGVPSAGDAVGLVRIGAGSQTS
jgi:hypothetical protein